MSSSELRGQLADSVSVPLRVRARQLASGFSTGQHRATRKGSGIEFAGHRAYTPGDDLRHLDHHALLRHGRHLIREFYTDTERAVHIVVDDTRSMHHRSKKEKGRAEPPRKLDRALLLGATAAHITRTSGDNLGLSLLGERDTTTWRPRSGAEAYERILSRLEESWTASLDERDSETPDIGKSWMRLIQHLGAVLPRGTLILVISDCFDIDEELAQELARLNSKKRSLRAAQLLSRDEKLFPFAGSVRLLDPETQREVETDADSVRRGYQKALASHTASLKSTLQRTGGDLTEHLVDDRADDALRFLLQGDLP